MNRHTRMTNEVTSTIGDQEINMSNDKPMNHIKHYPNPNPFSPGFLCLGGVHFYVRASVLYVFLNKIYYGGYSSLRALWGWRSHGAHGR